MKNKYQNRARGMFVGLAVGDALGAPIEFLPEPSDVHISAMGDKIAHFHDNYRAAKGVWTDDTEMALVLADSLLVNGGYDSYDIMRRFLAWADEGYRTSDGKPAADVGGQTLRALREFENHPIIFADDPKTDSAGNGAIMRLAPIILANAKNSLADVIEMARLSCRETHNSEIAEEYTEKFATMLLRALDGEKKNEITKGFEDDMTRSADELKNLGGYVVDTFAIAIWGLLNFDDFKSGMLAVLRLGGDTDTNAACYGQLAGAYYGYDHIPEEWRTGVHLSDELVKVADDLLALDSCPVLKTRFEDAPHFQEPD